MAYAIPLWTPPALLIAGSGDTFPVRRIFCVGRNYVEHQKEMGGDGREQPFFFIKSEFALVPGGGDVTMAQLIPGVAISFPDVWLGALPASADFYLKWVFRSDDAVLTRFLLQVTKGA